MRFRVKTYEAGFTIVELLIAASITVLIVLMLGTMFGSLTKTASRANQRIDAFRDARAALQTMERDLAGLVKAPQTAYFALDKRWQPGGGDAGDPYTNQGSNAANQQLFALVSMKNQPQGKQPNQIGDVCTIGYYCYWEGNRYTLRRFFRESVSTYNTIKNSGGGTSYTPPSALFTPIAKCPTGNSACVADDILASYIWNLRITAYKPDGTKDTTYPLVIDPSKPNVALPSAIEIEFDAMSPEGAKTVMGASSNPQDWMDTTRSVYKTLILPHLYEFRTRIGFN